MRNWTKDLGLKLASVLVALVLFVYVQSQASLNDTKEVSFKVRTLGTPPDGFVVTKIVPSLVTVKAEGLPTDIGVLKKMADRDAKDPDKLIAYLNLSETSEGTHQYAVRIQRQDEYPELHSLSWPSPDRVSVTVEPQISIYKKVLLDKVNLPRGYSLKQASITPDTLRLTGTKAAVGKVAEVRALIDLKDFKPGAQYPNTRVELLDGTMTPVSGVTTDTPTVSVIPVLVDAGARQRNVLVSPVWVGEPAFGYKIKSYTVSPNQVVVTGDPDVLNSIVSVDTDPIDIKGITADVTRRVALNAKDGVEAPKRQVRVSVRVIPDPTAHAPAKPVAPTSTPPPKQ